MPYRIAIIEDDTVVLELIEKILKEQKYNTCSCTSGKPAFKLIKDYCPQLVILDLYLPDINGLRVLADIKKDELIKHIPVIIITGKYKEISDVIKGFEDGADDYITKPFNYDELVARIEAVLRRTYRRRRPLKYTKTGEIYIDLENCKIYIGNNPINCSNMEIKVLKLLLGKPGKTIYKMDIIEKIWSDYDENYDRVRTLDKLISRLRKKLGEKGAELIKTVYGKGYRFQPEYISLK